VDTGALLSKINKAVPHAVSEKQRFGRTEFLCLWVVREKLRDVAALLKADAEEPFDWLENLVVMQSGQEIVATYFLRSSQKQNQLLLRTSVKPSSQTEWVELPSISSVWESGEPMEMDAAELFGVRFTDALGKPKAWRFRREEMGWTGFPLRKNLVREGGHGNG